MAPWRRLPEDPARSIGWILRWGKRLHRFDWMGFFASVLLFGVMFGTLCAAARAKGEDVGPVLFLLVVAPVTGILGAWKFRRSDAEKHAALPTVAGTFEAIPVTLKIYQGRLTVRETGRETGWVSFADGWLVYEGVRTDFALRPQDVFGFCRVNGATELDLMDNRRVLLSPLESEAATATPAKKEARDRLERGVGKWQRGVNPPGRSILPPRALHPETVGNAIGHRIAFGVASMVTAFWALRCGSVEYAAAWTLLAVGAFAWALGRIGAFRRELPSMIE